MEKDEREQGKLAGQLADNKIEQLLRERHAAVKKLRMTQEELRTKAVAAQGKGDEAIKSLSRKSQDALGAGLGTEVKALADAALNVQKFAEKDSPLYGSAQDTSKVFTQAESALKSAPEKSKDAAAKFGEAKDKDGNRCTRCVFRRCQPGGRDSVEGSWR